MKNATSFTKLATLSVERNAATYHEPVALSEIATISVANDTRDGNETNALKQLELNHDLDRKPFSEEKTLSEPLFESSDVEYPCVDGDLIVWQGSSTAQTLQCRGWNRSDDEWQRRFGTAVVSKRRDDDLVRCAEDSKFRTRLCNHWDTSLGTFCPMRKKNKCIFAHGPVELRVKEAKRNRWGKLVDANGDNNNPNHSGGEDSYGAARSIEHERKQEGKWNSEKPNHAKGKKSQSTKKKQPAEIISQS